MSVNLFIGDDELDLLPNTIVPLTLKYFDIGNIVSRFSNFSQRINLPKTGNNLLLLGLDGNEKSTSDIPYQNNDVKLIINGVQFFPEAYAVIDSLSDRITIQLFSGAYDFFRSIDGLKLSDLDMSSYDQSWNLDDQDTAATSTSGLVAPYINYGKSIDQPPNAVAVVKSIHNPPSIYYADVISQIFTDAGITVSGDIFTDTKYLKMIIPFSRDKFDYNKSFNEAREAVAINTSTQNYVSPSTALVEFDTIVSQGSAAYYDDTTSIYEVDEASFTTRFMEMDIKVTLTIDVSGGDVEIKFNGTRTQQNVIVTQAKTYEDGTDETITLSYRELGIENLGYSSISGNCTPIDGDQITITVDTVSITGSITAFANAGGGKVTVTSNNHGLNDGYKVAITGTTNYNGTYTVSEITDNTFEITETWVSNDATGTFDVAPTVDIDNAKIEFIVYNSAEHTDLELDVAVDVLPEMTQIELITDFVVRHGLILSQYQNTITAKTFNEVIDDKANAVDWTEKRDYSIVDKLAYKLTQFGQNNYFNYPKNDEDAEENLGRGSFTTSNETVKRTSDLYNSIFSSTYTNPDLYGLEVADFSLYDYRDWDVIPEYVYSNLVETSSPGLRLLLVRTRRGGEPNPPLVSPFVLASTPSSSIKVAYFEDSVESDTMDWDDFFTDHYSSLWTSLDKIKVVTRFYNLNQNDVLNFDPFKPIFDDGSYFIVNEIKNYIPDQLTEVELLKIV